MYRVSDAHHTIILVKNSFPERSVLVCCSLCFLPLVKEKNGEQHLPSGHS
ncbi:hypothetical protein [Yersinia ruckeri]|nr:hypothetical protein [Yersinia ruckeri]MCW6625095.1 hypothetical protein [Yersinia ruckeri]